MTTMATDVIETTALATMDQGSPLPVFSGAMMTKALIAYKELQKALDESMPDAIMELDGKPYRKKSYWRAVAVAFNLSVEPVEERREVSSVFADNRENFGFVVTYRATAPNGRSAVGDGSCFAVEKARRFKCPHQQAEGSSRTLHFPNEACPDFDPAFQWRTLPAQSTEHNIRGHAHTRAYNRAVSNLVGFGEVSAEEVVRDEHVNDEKDVAQPIQKREDGSALVTAVAESSGKSTKGKPWTRWAISFDDGRSGSTFDAADALKARTARDAKTLVVPTFEVDGKYTNLTRLDLPVVGQQPSLPDTEPVGGPEKILTVLPVKPEHSAPYWRICSDRREYVTNIEGVAQLAEQFRVAKPPTLAYIAFEPLQGAKGAHNRITEFGEAKAQPPAPAVVKTEALAAEEIFK